MKNVSTSVGNYPKQVQEDFFGMQHWRLKPLNLQYPRNGEIFGANLDASAAVNDPLYV